MTPHVRNMLIYWPPILGLVGLGLAAPLGRLFFGPGHAPGEVLGFLFVLVVARPIGIVSIIAAKTESPAIA